jgi:hypothetical protein
VKASYPAAFMVCRTLGSMTSKQSAINGQLSASERIVLQAAIVG